ncbi:hypothetical protein FS842_001069 [Serendipita sp. 407]|nr:hypothetical protein FS842_001069 [Serendipita sp. 407]
MPCSIYSVLFIAALLQLHGLQVVSAAKSCSCRTAEQKAVKDLQFRVSYTPTTTDSVVLSGWSAGGGDRRKIPFSNSSSPGFTIPFEGREYGGGSRKQIYGTRAYGSGYPYGVSSFTTIAGRPFPFVMWPISWGPGYLGGEEYDGPTMGLIRPGGPLGVAKVGTTDVGRWPYVSSDEVYEIIGDKESLNFIMAQLVDRCKITPQWPIPFNPLSTTANTTRPETVIQYYRASSFALAFSGYNNTFALPSNATTIQGWDQSSPLPINLTRSSFLLCVNSTIGSALPIMHIPTPKSGLSTGALVGIVIGGIFGGCIAWIMVFKIYMYYKERKTARRQKEQKNARRRRRGAHREEAEIELVGAEAVEDDGKTLVNRNDEEESVKGAKVEEHGKENVVYL